MDTLILMATDNLPVKIPGRQTCQSVRCIYTGCLPKTKGRLMQSPNRTTILLLAIIFIAVVVVGYLTPKIVRPLTYEEFTKPRNYFYQFELDRAAKSVDVPVDSLRCRSGPQADTYRFCYGSGYSFYFITATHTMTAAEGLK